MSRVRTQLHAENTGIIGVHQQTHGVVIFRPKFPRRQRLVPRHEPSVDRSPFGPADSLPRAADPYIDVSVSTDMNVAIVEDTTRVHDVTLLRRSWRYHNHVGCECELAGGAADIPDGSMSIHRGNRTSSVPIGQSSFATTTLARPPARPPAISALRSP